MFKKIPLIGSLLASAAGFAGPALFGALGVIPIGYATKLFANIMPNLDSRIYYAAMGLLVAAFVKTAKFLPIGESTRNLLAVGVASAAGAVAAYKTMRSDETDMNGEMGVLAIADGFSGFGDLSIPGYQVLPGYGDTSYAIIPGYGNTLADEAAELGALYREIGDAQPGDALACGDDLDWGELEVALSGPGRWRRSFRPARQISGRRPSGMSAHAGQQGTRWNWLIKLVGYQTFQQLASLPPEQRKGYLQQLRGQARSIASQALSTSVDADPGMSGYGALMLATNI